MDSLESMVARIDERTQNIGEDVKEVKQRCCDLTEKVEEHSEKLVRIETKLKSNGTSSLSTKQKAGLWTGLVAFVTAIIVAVTEYFTRH